MNKMENIIINISRKQHILSNLYWILFYVIVTVVIGCVYSAYPQIIFIVVFIYMLVDVLIFNRGMRKIVAIAVDDNEIVLTYYKLWVKKTTHISRQTLGKIKVERHDTKLSLYIYDKRWVRAPCMYVEYSECKLDYLLNNICESREDIENAIALFEKYNYHIDFENK